MKLCDKRPPENHKKSKIWSDNLHIHTRQQHPRAEARQNASVVMAVCERML